MHFEGLAALGDESRACRRESLGDIRDHAFSLSVPPVPSRVAHPSSCLGKRCISMTSFGDRNLDPPLVVVVEELQAGPFRQTKATFLPFWIPKRAGLSLSPKGKTTGHESSGLLRLLRVSLLRVLGPLLRSNKSHINVSGCRNDSIRPGQLQPNSPVSVFTKKRTDQGILSQAPRTRLGQEFPPRLLSCRPSSFQGCTLGRVPPYAGRPSFSCFSKGEGCERGLSPSPAWGGLSPLLSLP